MINRIRKRLQGRNLMEISRCSGVPYKRLWNFKEGKTATLRYEDAEKLKNYFLL